MFIRLLIIAFSMLALGGCASLFAPSAERLSALPVVNFPDKAPEGDFVLKFTAGVPIPVRVAVKGTALARGAEGTLAVTLPHDLYVHRRWASEDGQTWKPANDVLAIQLALSIPSDEHPKAGEITVSVDRKDMK